MASLFGALVVPARLFPEWDASAAFGKMYTASALMYDGKRSARALEGPTPSAAAADGAFDALRWTKSGAVLHMLRAHVGEEALLRGVRAVLKEYAHGSAGSAELWDKVSKAAGKDVRGMMKGWTTQVRCRSFR
jgi:aminopeptidase N